MTKNSMIRVAIAIALVATIVLSCCACSFEIGEGSFKYLSVDGVTVAVGETAEIPVSMEGYSGQLQYTYDSDCISIENDMVTGLKVGVATVTVSIEDTSLDFEVTVVEPITEEAQ